MGGWVGAGCMVVVMRRGRRRGGCGGGFGLSFWGCWGGLCGRRFGGKEALEVVVAAVGGVDMAVAVVGKGVMMHRRRRRIAGLRRSRRQCRRRDRRGGDRGFGAG